MCFQSRGRRCWGCLDCGCFLGLGFWWHCVGIMCGGGGGSGAWWWECCGRKQDTDMEMNCSIPDLGGHGLSGCEAGILLIDIQ